jgi:hypothetical protein
MSQRESVPPEATEEKFKEWVLSAESAPSDVEMRKMRGHPLIGIFM